jgi:hypothetical protein
MKTDHRLPHIDRWRCDSEELLHNYQALMKAAEKSEFLIIKLVDYCNRMLKYNI